MQSLFPIPRWNTNVYSLPIIIMFHERSVCTCVYVMKILRLKFRLFIIFKIKIKIKIKVRIKITTRATLSNL